MIETQVEYPVREYYWIEARAGEYIVGERQPPFVQGSRITTADKFTCCYGLVTGDKLLSYLVGAIKKPV